MIEIRISCPSTGLMLGCRAITPELAQELEALGEDIHDLNVMRWPTGASKHGCGVFLMLSDDANQLPSDGSIPLQLQLLDDQATGIDNAGYVNFDKLYAVEFRPIHIVGDTGVALYAVKLVDERYFWSGFLCDKNFNVTTTADPTVYYDSTKNSGTPWTWTEMLNELVNLLGVTVTMALDESTIGDPRDYLLSNERVDLSIDRIVAALGMVFAACPVNNSNGDRYQIAGVAENLTDNSSHSIFSLDQTVMLTTNEMLGDRISGGESYVPSQPDGIDWLNAIMPSSVTVRFPRQIPAGNVDSSTSSTATPLIQFYTKTSSAGIPSNTTGRAGFTVLVNDAMWAIGLPGAETNLAALATRADYVSTAYYRRWLASIHNTRMRGFINLAPIAGDLVWRHTMGGAFTDLHTTPPWTVQPDDQITGLMGIQTHRDANGNLFVTGGGNSTISGGGSITIYSASVTASGITGLSIIGGAAVSVSGSNATINADMQLVYLTTATGSGGDTSNSATFTYNVYSDSGHTKFIAGTQTMLAPRLFPGPWTAASYGLWSNISGSLVIAYESAGNAGC